MAMLYISNKRRLTSLLLAAVIICGVLVTGATTTKAADAGCANWYNSGNGNPYCAADGCGFLWKSDTQYQSIYQTQKCMKKSGEIYYKHRTITQKLGCC